MNRRTLCAKDIQDDNKTDLIETFSYFCIDCTDVTKTIYVIS